MIRLATLEDAPEIARMGARFFPLSSNARFMAFDWESVEAMARAYIENEQAAVWIAKGGTCAVVLYPFFYNQNHIKACGSWLWVDPDSRTGLGLKLRRTMEDWAMARGAHSLDMAANSDVSPDIMGRWYRQGGYGALETIYTRAL